MQTRYGRSRTGYSAGSYRLQLILHPLNALAVFCGLVVGELTGRPGPIMLAMAAAEGLALAAAPWASWVRRALDPSIALAEGERAYTARQRRALRMTPEHLSGYRELLALAEVVRASYGAEVYSLLGVDQLLDLYVRLGLAHRFVSTLLASSGSDRPEESLAQVTQGRVESASTEGRAELLRMRVEARRAARGELAALAEELAAVGDAIRLMAEQCAAARDPSREVELQCWHSSRRADAETARDLLAMRREVDTDDVPDDDGVGVAGSHSLRGGL